VLDDRDGDAIERHDVPPSVPGEIGSLA
jgi:hypothetical protein